MTDDFEIEATGRLARIEEQVKSLNGWMRDHITAAEKKESAVDTRVVSTEARLSQLELWRARIQGVAIGVGVVSGTITAVVTALIMRAIGG